MTMVVHNRQRIFYRYEGERGAYLMLHHGLFGSHEDWYNAGYVENLAKDFRLVIPDARGHGRSDRPTDPALYTPAIMADDIIALMDEMNIRNMHFLGVSLGALVGFDLLSRFPDRVRIGMFFGEAPFVMEESREQWRQFAGQLQGSTYGAFQAWLWENRQSLPPPHWKGGNGVSRDTEGEDAASLPPGLLPGQDYDPDLEAKKAALAMLEGFIALEPHSQDRVSVQSPVAIFTADQDPVSERVKEARQNIHRARLVSFPGVDHLGAFQERNAMLAEINRLLKSRERQPQPGRRDSEEAGENKEWAMTPPPPVDTEGAPPAADAQTPPEAKEGRAKEAGKPGGRGAPARTSGQAGAQDDTRAEEVEDYGADENGAADNGADFNGADFNGADENGADENGREAARVASVPDEIPAMEIEEEGPEYPEDMLEPARETEYEDDDEDEEDWEEEEDDGDDEPGARPEENR